jgi:predicted small metal-binding protein
VPRKLDCIDLGFACDAGFEAENDEELLAQARQHAVLEHPDEPLDDDDRLRALIREA